MSAWVWIICRWWFWCFTKTKAGAGVMFTAITTEIYKLLRSSCQQKAPRTVWSPKISSTWYAGSCAIQHFTQLLEGFQEFPQEKKKKKKKNNQEANPCSWTTAKITEESVEDSHLAFTKLSLQRSVEVMWLHLHGWRQDMCWRPCQRSCCAWMHAVANMEQCRTLSTSASGAKLQERSRILSF